MEDKYLQKIPNYSLDKIVTKSDLATRGMRELGLVKDKKHFTTIYACQFCGRLINYSSTPCIFCGKYPTTKKEVVIAQALSSESMSVRSQLQSSYVIKGGKDLEIEIAGLRDLIDRVTGDWEAHDTYHMLFAITQDVTLNKNKTAERDHRRLAMTKAECLVCGKSFPFLHDKCEGCGAKFSDTQKITLAIKGILNFIEIFLDDDGDDWESLEELIFVLVYTLTKAVEKDEYPDQVQLKHIYELLHKIHYLLARGQGVGVEIKDGEARRIGGSDGEAQTKQDWLAVLLAQNSDYLLQEYKKNEETLKNVIKFTGDEYLQIASIVKPVWENSLSEAQPKFVVFTGGVGAGKTTIRRKQFAEGYVHFDFGEILTLLKKTLGENHPRLKGYTNLACDMILKEVILEKKNIVIEIIGDNYEQMTPVIDKMLEKGYKTSVNHIEADIAQAYERHLKAVQEDPDYLSAYYTQEATLTYFYHYFNLGGLPNPQE